MFRLCEEASILKFSSVISWLLLIPICNVQAGELEET